MSTRAPARATSGTTPSPVAGSVAGATMLVAGIKHGVSASSEVWSQELTTSEVGGVVEEVTCGTELVGAFVTSEVVVDSEVVDVDSCTVVVVVASSVVEVVELAGSEVVVVGSSVVEVVLELEVVVVSQVCQAAQ